MFYTDRKKIVPKNLNDFLDDLALAVWFMDDGSHGHAVHSAILNTSSFSATEQFVLQRFLLEKFGIKVNIHKVGNGHQLYVTAGSYVNFYKRVLPYLIPSLRYKLVDPVTTEFRQRGKR